MAIKSFGNSGNGGHVFIRAPAGTSITSINDKFQNFHTVFDLGPPTLLERVGLPSHAKEQDVIDVLEGIVAANLETEKERCVFVRNSRLKELWGHRPQMFDYVVYQVMRESYSYRKK